MSKRFFERLDKRAWDLGQERIDRDDNEAFGLDVGINSTTEVLKEMMVIPLEVGKIEHCEDITVVSTLDPDGEFTPWVCIADEIIGTDGEEVTVLVVRL